MRTFAAITTLFALSAAASLGAEQPAAEIGAAAGVEGGLVVHLHCGDGRLTAALRTGDEWVVQGLDTDPGNVARARAHIRSLGLGGGVSAARFDGRTLPYVDNLVNLVVAEDLGTVDPAEVMRVLCPGGVLCVRQGDAWTATVKPWPEDIGQWTHYLHGPDNNAVTDDRVVGPPRHIQWIGEPRFSRSHDHLASVSAMVSAGGRLFSIVDVGSLAFAAARPRWRLVARDAFSGVRLWQREVAPWEYHLRDFRSGPADLARRLVAVEDRVYVTLGYGRPVSALDAATGATLRTYAGTEGAQEILYDGGTLLLVLGEPQDDWPAERARQIVSQPDHHPPFDRTTPPAAATQVMAVAAETGERLWVNAEPYTRGLMPSTLASSAGRVYFQNAGAIVCLDAATGRLQWQSPRPIHRTRLAWSTPTLVVHDGVVFSADRRAEDTDGEVLWIPSGGYHEYIRGEGAEGELVAFDAATGERLWNCPAYEGFNAPVDVMIADGLLWTGRYAWGNEPGITHARDPKTGEVRRQRPADQETVPRMGHARCHRAKATTRYLILGRRGVEFVDLETGDMTANFWVRGVCQYGVMPANGLLYVPPHPCACNYADMLKSGFMALAPERGPEAAGPSDSAALEPGPAYGWQPPDRAPDPADWPTHRGNPARSGATAGDLPRELSVAWQADLGGRLTAPVVAEGVLLVAAPDAHQVHALDAAGGRVLWTSTGAARVDSPPTIDRGRVLFGSADGWVYCLRLTDGTPVWRFRAAAQERQIVVDEQLESVWPVSGSVLVVEGGAYFVAGRNSYLDGGMLLYRLDPATGEVRNVVRLEVDRARRDAGAASGGHLPDILASDGRSLFLRSARFNLDLQRQKDDTAHLFSPVGFLDDTWWHRSYWQIGTAMGSGWGGWPQAGQRVPAGRLLATDGSRVFGFGRNQYHNPGAHVGIDAGGVWGPIGEGLGRWTYYRLFGQSLGTATARELRRGAEPAEGELSWTQRIPVLCRAMVLAGPTLLVAGPEAPVDCIPHDPSEVDPIAEALEADRGGRLLAVSTADGGTLAELDLPSPPVFDGMAAARGRVYLSTKNGKVVCLGSDE